MTLLSYLLLVGVLLGGWAGIQYAIAYYGNTAASKLLSDVILSNREADDVQMHQKALYALQDNGFKDAVEEDVIVDRSKNGRQMKIKYAYTHHVKIPFVDQTWDLAFVAEAEERIGR